MGVTGITALGAYIPWHRISRRAIAAQTGWLSGAKGDDSERSWTNWDEDTVTMAVEAARDCLVEQPADALRALTVCSTTAPFADRASSAILIDALGLPTDSLTADTGGSLRAATSALLATLRGNSGPTLCVASEQITTAIGSPEELIFGDGAAAALVGDDPPVLEFLSGATVAGDFVDHFRAADRRHNYWWESRWIRDEGIAKLVPQAVSDALASAGLEPTAVDRFVFPTPVRGAAALAARKAGISSHAVEAEVTSQVGFAGAAAPLLDLAAACERATPGEIIVVAAFGAGADALVFRRTSEPLCAAGHGPSGWVPRRRREDNYVKFLAARGEVALGTGMRGEFDEKQSMPALWRNRQAMLGLQAAADDKGQRFPPAAGTPHEASRVELANRPATITTFTADHLAFSLNPPTMYGLIDFPEGGRMLVEYCDTEVEALEVGREVHMMFRIKAKDERRGFRSYFWKATPTRPSTRVERGSSCHKASETA